MDGDDGVLVVLLAAEQVLQLERGYMGFQTAAKSFQLRLESGVGFFVDQGEPRLQFLQIGDERRPLLDDLVEMADVLQNRVALFGRNLPEALGAGLALQRFEPFDLFGDVKDTLRERPAGP